MKETSNGIHHGVIHPFSTGGLARCPTCGSSIAQEECDRILRIGEARQKQFADERAGIDRERAEVDRERAKIASAAVATERAKWEAETARAQRDVERLQKQADAEQQRLVRAHEKELQAEVRKREAQEKQLARELAAVQAKARSEAEALVREAKRAAEKQQSSVVDGLREQLKTLEQRRHRDEDALKRTIADLQRKAEGRDRTHFGPESEEALVAILRQQFPGDRVEHRGQRGDVLHVVVDGGREAGKIVLEMKKTRAWQAGYVRQTTLAMESHGTRYGVLVTHALPARSSGLSVVGGVIVAAPAVASHVVAVLRDAIVTIARLRVSEDGKAAKSTALFEYLRSDDFGNAIQRVQQRVAELREGLSKERSHHEGSWSARENHYASLLREAAGIDARVKDLLGGGHRAEDASMAAE
jgi:hypothetical protein